MTDLSTTYLGLKLRNPIVVSSSSLTASVDKVRALDDAGAGGVVLKSIFEEQLSHDAERIETSLSAGAGFAEATNAYFADIPMDLGPGEYYKLVENTKKAVEIPVIASINCTHAGAWAEYAKGLESSGADALELNLYFLATDTTRKGSDIESQYLEVVREVRSRVKMPIAVKLSPFLTSVPHMVTSLAQAGAQGAVLFNRFYQPNFDLDDLGIRSTLDLSRPEDALLPLRWIALLYGRVSADLAATTGVHDGKTVAKMILAGAAVTQVASALYRHKAGHLTVMLRELEAWMKNKEYASIAEMRGILSQKSNPNPEAFERAQYIKVLVGHD
jgi:dihydroorotate dehydrogenase (fumarate)